MFSLAPFFLSQSNKEWEKNWGRKHISKPELSTREATEAEIVSS